MAQLRLYDYAASANCYKVRLLLAQLGREYERVPVDIFDGDTLTDDFREINPARATPVLHVAERGFLAESNAILAYLAERTPLMPGDPFERAQVLRWLLFEQTGVMMTVGGLRFRLLTARITPDSAEARRRRDGALSALDVLEHHLRSHDFCAGDRYTVADIALFGYVHVAPDAEIDLGAYPAVARWLDRVRSQPGHVNDLEPYPANARAGVGRSVYG